MNPVDIRNALNIHGWMSANELNWLAKTAQRSKVIVEFGCYFGRSTRVLADHCSGIVYAVDPWTGEYFDNNNQSINILRKDAYFGFLQNMADHIDSGKLAIYKCVSGEFPEFKADFIFIDGDHRYEEVKKDIEKARRMIMPGGIIAGHDYTHDDWPGVKQAVSEAFGNVEVVDTIWFQKL